MKFLHTTFIIVLLSLNGCSSQQIELPCVEKPRLNLQDPASVELQDISFRVVTRENAESVFKELESKGLKPVLIALSGTDYKILAINVNKLQNYILLEQEVLKKYREYYEPKK